MQILKNASLHSHHHLIGIIAGIAFAFLLTVMCYWPSLSGPFLFDDIPNLEILGDRGGLTSTDKYLEFIMSAQAGPLGRPLSLASFTLDGQTWPTDPHPFRVTNLVIHLVNGLLVFMLTRLIFCTAHKQDTAAKLALVCMALWLLHPLLVSTTAYIIQRMTQLGSLFTLAGLLCYMHGRASLLQKPRHGWAWIIAGMGFCGALALLSKESGILLPLFALVIELTIFGTSSLPGRQGPALIATLSAPLVAVIGYMALNWPATLLAFDLRPFTMEERLLTQIVVLLDYLQQIIAPRLSGLGIFHDDFPISRGLLEPIGTLVSGLVIAVLIFLAVKLRKTWPFISLGLLWFFAAHSLEAGPISLELYFEHRNYLALLGPLVLICSLLPLLSDKLRRLLPLLLVLFIGMEGFLTWQAAIPWGNENRLMQTTLVEHPDSLRAQQYVVNQHIIHNNYSDALVVQEGLAVKFPEHTSTRLSILNLRCILKTLSVDQISATQQFVENSAYDRQVIGFFGPLFANATAGNCGTLGLSEFHGLLDALLRNPTMTKSAALRGAVHYHKGFVFKSAGNLTPAIEQLNLSYAAKPEIDIRLRQIVWLLEAGNAGEAQRYISLAQQHGKTHAWSADYRAADLEILQQVVDKALDSGP